jgi:1,4-alpha-glucan branching enzyme
VMRTDRVNFIFNAHLPFVRHPEYPKFLEEDWLYEAINESYIPLLKMMFKLKDEGVKFRLTFSISPTLCAMLSDTLLRDRFANYMNEHLELGYKELDRLAKQPEVKALAQNYVDALNENIQFYEKYDHDILKAFNELSNAGYLEIITTTATHAFLPAFKDYPIASNAQIETGVMNHLRMFDKMTEGFWLPECGYYPGLEHLLTRHNIKWISLSSQAFILSQDEPKQGCYAPVKCPNGLYCFARDYHLTSLVWSSTEGYPCDPDYREFYRDIGYDLPMEYIGPYIHEPEVRVFTGFKYWAITGKTPDKVIYNPEKAKAKLDLHSSNFLYHIKSMGSSVESYLTNDPVFTISFDAELFGHWWYEGVQWLEKVIRKVAMDPSMVLATPGEIVALDEKVDTLRPAYSTWGEGGYSQVWVDNSTNAWAYRHIFKALEHITELADRFPKQSSLKQRFLNQAARETLLLMASDWPFIIHNHTSEEYAKKRLEGHLQNVNLVYENMCRNAVNTEWLVKAEKRDNLFAWFDYNIFNSKHLNEDSPIFTTDFSKN